MTKRILTPATCLALGAVLLGAARTKAAPTDDLKGFLAEPRDQRGNLAGQAFAAVPLTKEQAAAAKQMLWDDWAAMVRQTRQKEWDEKEITVDGATLKLKEKTFGTKPANGWNLFISMHGGGTDPGGQTNDAQWENQLRLPYDPADSLYVAPRAPGDTWDMWFTKPVDGLFKRLIQDAIVLGEVDPNRCYVMGYSAGGDGTYRMGSRMADSWAAAAMSAGHPGDVSPLSLRNIGFAIHVGGKDTAYKRNEEAAKFGKKLDDLEKGDPNAYKHQVQIHENKPHWMDMEDKVAVKWMLGLTRDPIPAKVVWMQGDVPHDNFYWLATPMAGAKKKQLAVVSREGQKFTIEKVDGGLKNLTVMMNDAMLNLDRPVTITYDGKNVYTGTPARTIAELSRTTEDRGDPYLVFSAEQSVSLEK